MFKVDNDTIDSIMVSGIPSAFDNGTDVVPSDRRIFLQEQTYMPVDRIFFRSIHLLSPAIHDVKPLSSVIVFI